MNKPTHLELTTADELLIKMVAQGQPLLRPPSRDRSSGNRDRAAASESGTALCLLVLVALVGLIVFALLT